MLVQIKEVSSKTKQTRRTRNRSSLARKPRAIIKIPVSFARHLKDLIIMPERLTTPMSVALRNSATKWCPFLTTKMIQRRKHM